MSRKKLPNGKTFLDRPPKRITQALANAHKTAEQRLTSEQKEMLPPAVKVTRRMLSRFISTARHSPYYEHDSEEQAENDAFVVSLSDRELIRNYGVFDSIFCHYALKYFHQKDDRRKKIKNLSRAAAALKMLDDIKIHAEKRGIIIKSDIIK